MTISKRQLVKYLDNFRVSELRELSKYFNIRVTRQNGGGACSKQELIQNLVGGSYEFLKAQGHYDRQKEQRQGESGLGNTHRRLYSEQTNSSFMDNYMGIQPTTNPGLLRSTHRDHSIAHKLDQDYRQSRKGKQTVNYSGRWALKEPVASRTPLGSVTRRIGTDRIDPASLASGVVKSTTNHRPDPISPSQDNQDAISAKWKITLRKREDGPSDNNSTITARGD